MTDAKRAQLDERIRSVIRVSLADRSAPEDLEDVAFLLIRLLPECVDRRNAHGQVEAAYDLHALRRPELDRALPMDTGPFDLQDPS